MKVSEITIKELSDYLKLDFESLTEEEKAELNAFLSSPKPLFSNIPG